MAGGLHEGQDEHERDDTGSHERANRQAGAIEQEGKRLADRPLFLPQGLNVGDSGTAQTL
mgnify:CR=1 FL=1